MIDIKNAVLRNPDIRFREPVSLMIGQGEQIAFVGPNGSGKSVLAQMITGRYPLKEGHIIYGFSPSPVYENIKFIAFKDSYGPADSSYYLQQRWNSQDRDESPLVRDILGSIKPDDFNRQLFTWFEIEGMLDKQLVLLSSGEMRKFQLTKTLLMRPRILIIDNPFIGLDAVTRKQLCDLLGKIVRMKEAQIILLLAKTDEIPDFITHIIPVTDMHCKNKVKWSDFRIVPPEMPDMKNLFLSGKIFAQDIFMTGKSRDVKEVCDTIIEMRNVSIRYGTRTIIDSLNWTVKCGEKWALLGQNGSGKSTLLSLVCADNPQGYACDISLFGTRRGSGESIWEIKKRIGYVSPEMHRAYSENIPAIDIVASGLHDSIGLYVRPKPEQLRICEWWMNVFGILHLRERKFLQISDGEQRMLLLARAFVKDPELLILDEPMHGLDSCNRLLVQAVIDAFCRRPNKTFIMVTHYEQELPVCVDKFLKLGDVYE